MLESPSLVLCRPGPDGRRAILHADTRRPLGFACRRQPTGFWSWLTAPALEIHEEEDAPLLFTMGSRWRWSAWRHVRDADGHRVGALVGNAIVDDFNLWVASTSWNGTHKLTLVNPKGEPLAQVEFGADAARLDFRPEVAREPFLKMLLLAAALDATTASPP